MIAHDAKTRSRLWRCGALLQGVILGLLVSIAITELVASTDAVRLFRYQAF